MNKLMCHVVAGYPDPAACVDLMLGMERRGVQAIEVQIPFSDPIADGEVIMGANDVALQAGMTTAGSLKLLKQARQAGLGVHLYVMSYIQKVQHYGIERFCKEAAVIGVSGLIIPDLPYDTDEHQQLGRAATAAGLELVPVLSPDMPQSRLSDIVALQPSSIYVTSQKGITGLTFQGGQPLRQLSTYLRKNSKATIMVGFGINSKADIDKALEFGDIAIVGSAVIKRLQADGADSTLRYIKTLVGT